MVSARQATATPRINEVVDTYFEIMVVSCERSAKVAIGMARKSPPKLMSEMPGAASPIANERFARVGQGRHRECTRPLTGQRCGGSRHRMRGILHGVCLLAQE
jgi:hypothetical protein